MNRRWYLDDMYEYLSRDLNTYLVNLMVENNIEDERHFLLKNEFTDHRRFCIDSLLSSTRIIEINPHQIGQHGEPVSLEQVEITIRVNYEYNFLEVFAIKYDLGPDPRDSKVFFPINHPVILSDLRNHFMKWLALPFSVKLRGFNDQLETATEQYLATHPQQTTELRLTNFNLYQER
jgi:hypothetical protein